MSLPSSRQTFALIAAGCLGLILIGLYMQYGMKLIPCALCITQRIFIIAVGLTALVAFLHGPTGVGQKIYAGLGVIFAATGASFSMRQIYLQSLPADEAPACGPDIAYMFDNFPLMDALNLLLRGDGNCAEVAWTFLGVSIPGWTLVAFAGLAAFNLWQFIRLPRQQ
ncbi:MAG TPA: disulfide bond formation protein B [Marinagarivorans sp.]